MNANNAREHAAELPLRNVFAKRFFALASLVVLGGSLGFIVVGCGSNETAARASSPAAAKPCGDRMFGQIKSLVRKGDQFELRFDPAWFTSGLTANTAAAEDGVVPPGQPVPNDNYVVDEGHRTLLYLVPASAHVTVLTNTKDAGNLYATPVTVAELSQLVEGKEPVKLFEGLDTGFWARVHVDTVCSLDQQYHP
jgi:hypothetical protein